MGPTILIHEWVTGGGLAGLPLEPSWAVEGAAMRRALARDFASIASLPARVLVTLDDRFTDDPGAWDLLRIDPHTGAKRIELAMRSADYVLVIAPETSGILKEWAKQLERHGVRSLGSSPDAIAIATDKLHFATHLEARGVSTPKTQRADFRGGLPENFAYPAVLKPADGAGSVDTYRVESPGSFPASIGDLSREFLLQEFVEGDALSASFLVDRGGLAHKLAIGRQNMVIREGRFEYLGGEIPYGREVEEQPLLDAIRSIPGLLGFVGVDFIANRRTGETTVIEINPRATTSCVGLCQLLTPGRLAEAWLAACLDNSLEESDLISRLAEEIGKCGTISFGANGWIGSRSGEVP